MKKFFAYGVVCIGGLAAIAALVLGVYWLLWALWCWVMPQLWPTGPANLIQPNFWLFVAAWCLMSLVGRAIFGGSQDK